MFYTETISSPKEDPSMLSLFFQRISKMFEVVGYARAAAELNRLGYREEAKKCILEIRKLKE